MPDDLIVEPAASNLADHRLGVKVVRKTEFERACFVQLGQLLRIQRYFKRDAVCIA